MPGWKSIVREPLVHFVAIGAVLFAIDAWRAPAASDEVDAPAAVPSPAAPPRETAPSGPRTIVLDEAVRGQIAASAERRLGRAPSPADIAAETERWIDEEVLYREAIARGLDRDDPVIRQRIAARMGYVLEQAASVPEPSEAELRAWFDAHRDRWAVPERIDFTHVFVAGSDARAHARIAELERELRDGVAPERLGDRFSGGRRYRGRRIADLAQTFGEQFAGGLATQPPGAWVRRSSRHGLHLVRIDRVDAPRPADFTSARLDVRKAWLDERRASELAAAMKQLRTGWVIEPR